MPHCERVPHEVAMWTGQRCRACGHLAEDHTDRPHDCRRCPCRGARYLLSADDARIRAFLQQPEA